MACLNSFLSASVRCGKILRSSCSRLCRPVLRNLAKLSLRTTFAPSPTHTQTHTHPFKGPLSGTTRVSRYQKGKTSLDFTEARESEWQWHQLGRVQACTSLQTDNHVSTPPLSFLQAGCPSCRPTNSVKALKQQVKSYLATNKPLMQSETRLRNFLLKAATLLTGSTHITLLDI